MGEGGWVGGWVGGWMSCSLMDGKVEEEEAVRMSYRGLGMDGWVGGWVGTYVELGHGKRVYSLNHHFQESKAVCVCVGG